MRGHEERTVDYRDSKKGEKCAICEGETVVGFIPSLNTRFGGTWACYDVQGIMFNLCPEHNTPEKYGFVEKIALKMRIRRTE